MHPPAPRASIHLRQLRESAICFGLDPVRHCLYALSPATPTSAAIRPLRQYWRTNVLRTRRKAPPPPRRLIADESLRASVAVLAGRQNGLLRPLLREDRRVRAPFLGQPVFSPRCGVRFFRGGNRGVANVSPSFSRCACFAISRVARAVLVVRPGWVAREAPQRGCGRRPYALALARWPSLIRLPAAVPRSYFWIVGSAATKPAPPLFAFLLTVLEPSSCSRLKNIVRLVQRTEARSGREEAILFCGTSGRGSEQCRFLARGGGRPYSRPRASCSPAKKRVGRCCSANLGPQPAQ